MSTFRSRVFSWTPSLFYLTKCVKRIETVVTNKMVRCKNRYFAVEVQAKDRPDHAPLDLKKSSLANAIMRKIEEIHGDFGVGAITSGFAAKYCNPYTKIALIRCRHGPHRFVGTVLPLIKEIHNIPVKIRLIYTGATITKCYKYILNYQRKTLEMYWNKMKTDEDRLLMKKALADLPDAGFIWH